MSDLKQDVNSIVDQRKVKISIPDLPPPVEQGHVRAGSASEIIRNRGVIVGPVKITIETYDDTKDIVITDTSSVQHTLKTGKSGYLEDANGLIIDIEEIIFNEPV